jgi:transcription-repair coupling factor (superfamily II helicase)
VPEAEVRLNLYARLARLAEDETADEVEDEIADRFGPLPEPVHELVTLARFQRVCRRLGIARIDAGPQAVAVTFREGAAERPGIARAVAASDGVLSWREERLIYPKGSEVPGERRALVRKLLGFLLKRR